MKTQPFVLMCTFLLCFCSCSLLCACSQSSEELQPTPKSSETISDTPSKELRDNTPVKQSILEIIPKLNYSLPEPMVSPTRIISMEIMRSSH